MLSATGGLLGLQVYTRIAKRIPFHRLLFAAVPIKIIAILLYFAYRSRTAAWMLDGCVGFCDILSVAVIQELAARAAHPKYAALSFGIIIGVGSLAFRCGKVVASSLYVYRGFSFQQLLVVQALSVLGLLFLFLFLFLLPLIPKSLTKET